MHLSSAINPFLYSLLSKRFRRGFHDLKRRYIYPLLGKRVVTVPVSNPNNLSFRGHPRLLRMRGAALRHFRRHSWGDMVNTGEAAVGKVNTGGVTSGHEMRRLRDYTRKQSVKCWISSADFCFINFKFNYKSYLPFQLTIAAPTTGNRLLPGELIHLQPSQRQHLWGPPNSGRVDWPNKRTGVEEEGVVLGMSWRSLLQVVTRQVTLSTRKAVTCLTATWDSKCRWLPGQLPPFTCAEALLSDWLGEEAVETTPMEQHPLQVQWEMG